MAVSLIYKRCALDLQETDKHSANNPHNHNTSILNLTEADLLGKIRPITAGLSNYNSTPWTIYLNIQRNYGDATQAAYI